jgi:ornithine--oxo-acid transaminase
MIVDEIQTAFGRGAGNTTVCRSKNVKPDLLLLGKSLSGGFYPVSAVVGKNEVIDLIRPGDHGSTYGGNPLALKFVYSVLNYIANGKCILEVNDKEGIISSYLKFQNNLIKEIRGRGMMFGIEIFEDSPITANEISLYLMERGILCKPTKFNILRYFILKLDYLLLL